MVCIQNQIRTPGCRTAGWGCEQREHASKSLNEFMQIFIIVLIGEVVKEDNNVGVLEITYYSVHELIFIFVGYENMIQNALVFFSKLTFTSTTEDNKRNYNE